MRKGLGGHHRGFRGVTNEWLTPPDLIEQLGPFDLDPCATADQPWRTAKHQFTEGGLSRPWKGFVWCNPPYGPETKDWLKKLSDHGSGIALIFARTETKMFFDYIWTQADCLYFLEGRLHFHDSSGKRMSANAGAPSVLIGYGQEAIERLERDCFAYPGKLIFP